MSELDGLDGLFSREEVLGGGIHGLKVSRTLLWIESQTMYMVLESRRMIQSLVGQTESHHVTPDAMEKLGFMGQAEIELTCEHLEQYVPHWAHLVPDNPDLRARLIDRFSRKYNFTPAVAPRMAAALGLDNPAVRNAFEELYGDVPEMPCPAAEMLSSSQTEPAPHEEIISPTDIEAIAKEFEWIHLDSGESLFQQGDRGDNLYILINGRLRASMQKENESDVIVREIGQGDMVGEEVLLSETTYISTVYALRDSKLIKFSRASLDHLTNTHPTFIVQLMRRLASRLPTALRPSSVVSKCKTVALVSAHPDAHLNEFARRLVSALERVANILHVTPRVVDAALGDGVSQAAHDSEDHSRLMSWLSQQESQYDLLLYEADNAVSPWTRRCLRQADRVLIVTTASSPPEPGPIESELLMENQAAPHVRQELILLHPDRSQPPRNTLQHLTCRRVDRHTHIAWDAEADFERLARLLTGNAVGLVLSGGGLTGFMHLGAIRAIEEAGIPIDVIGGTSMGALVGAAYAQGWNVSKMVEEGRKFMRRVRSYFDFTLPIVSIISTRKLNKLLQEIYGAIHIEDLWGAYFCVSSNLTRSQIMVHRQGLLWRYVRASIALPSIMPPVLDDGEILVDGGVFNNLPVDVMRELCDGGPVIGINVSPRTDLPKVYHFDENLSALQLLWSRYNPFAEKLNAPSIAQLIYRSITSRRAESWQQFGARDVCIEFPGDDAATFETLIEIGYQTSLEKIKGWQRRRTPGK